MADRNTIEFSQYVGLDVHQETITIAVAPAGREEPRVVSTIRHDRARLRKELKRLGPVGELLVCYEAGGSGYTIARDLAKVGIVCLVIAPSMVPRRVGDRVKTDRKDACKLARSLRNGDLRAVHQPTEEEEALRDLSRLREQAQADLHRSRQRLLKFLKRHGVSEPAGDRWTLTYHEWLDGLSFPHHALRQTVAAYLAEVRAQGERLQHVTALLLAAGEASTLAPVIRDLQRLHGVGPIVAIGLMAELGDMRRFPTPAHLISYAGLIPGERSSGTQVRRDGITKTGNRHVRHLIIESAWHYAHRLKELPEPPITDEIGHLAWAARTRLSKRYAHKVLSGKPRSVAIIPVACDLLSLCWVVAMLLTNDATV